MSSSNVTSSPLGPLAPAGDFPMIDLYFERVALIANYSAVASLTVSWSINFTIYSFIHRTNLQILSWDIVTNIVNDYNFLKLGLNIPLCAYFASRLVKVFPLAFVSSNVE